MWDSSGCSCVQNGHQRRLVVKLNQDLCFLLNNGVCSFPLFYDNMCSIFSTIS